jgi:hypothetical protein
MIFLFVDTSRLKMKFSEKTVAVLIDDKGAISGPNRPNHTPHTQFSVAGDVRRGAEAEFLGSVAKLFVPPAQLLSAEAMRRVAEAELFVAEAKFFTAEAKLFTSGVRQAAPEAPRTVAEAKYSPPP